MRPSKARKDGKRHVLANDMSQNFQKELSNHVCLEDFSFLSLLPFHVLFSSLILSPFLWKTHAAPAQTKVNHFGRAILHLSFLSFSPPCFL